MFISFGFCSKNTLSHTHTSLKYFTLDISESLAMKVFFGSCNCLLQTLKYVSFLLKNLLLLKGCVFWYGSCFMMLDFCVSDNNRRAALACSITLQKKQTMPITFICVAKIVKKKTKKTVQLRLLCVSMGRLRWLRRLTRMPPVRLPLEVLWHVRPVGDPQVDPEHAEEII